MMAQFKARQTPWNKGKCLPKKGNRIETLGGVGLIHLQRGIALIDIEDIERVKGYTWHLSKKGEVRSGNSAIYLSRLILFGDNHNKDPRLADHKIHNLLDNRKNNLRPASYQQNGFNRLSEKKSTSKYKGVSWHKNAKKWRADIRAQEKNLHLGSFTKEEDAARAYDEAAKKFHGEFARLNFGEN